VRCGFADGLERRRPRLHECEARTSDYDSTIERFDVAEKRDVAGGDARVPVRCRIRAVRFRPSKFPDKQKKKTAFSDSLPD
jgi:hypothetical protein